MADNEVLIQIKADVADINAKLTDIKGNISKVTDETKKMGSDSKSSWEMMAAGIASTIYIVQQVIREFQQCAGIITDLAAAYGKAEISGLKLNAVLSAHGVQSLVEAYKAYAKEIEGLTGIHHTEIESLQAILTTMGVMPSQMKPAIEAAIALHNVFGKDLTSSAEMVAQALEGNFRQLQKLIPSLKGTETGSMSASKVLDVLKKSFGDVNEAISDAYLTKIDKLKSSWLSFKEEAIDSLIPALKTALDLMTALVKSAAKTGGGVTVDPETGEVIMGGPLTGMPLAGGAQGLPATKAIKPISDKNFITPPSHLLDALMKQWREKSAALEAQTFTDTLLFGEGTGADYSSLKFDDIMSPIVAQATKLKEQFKQVGGASGVIDEWLFGQLHAEDIKESMDMLKTNWEWFEKSKLLEERTAMNKVMNDELQITKDLNVATRARGDYEITEREFIEANISALKRQIQTETDRWNAMRPPKDAGDWTALNTQAGKIDQLTEKMKGLNNQLAKTSSVGTIVVAFKKYGDECSDIFTQIGAAGIKAMTGVEDAFVALYQTGKLSFTNLANSIIADLIRIQVRASITGPLSGWMGSIMQGLSMTFAPIGSPSNPNAQGNAFQDGNIIRFGLGGIVNSPTLFRMANGAGLMGEEGPEAVMPLTRLSGGKLGVAASGGSPQSVKVEIVNQSGQDVKATKSTATIDGQRMIVSVVIDAVNRNVGSLRDVFSGIR